MPKLKNESKKTMKKNVEKKTSNKRYNKSDKSVSKTRKIPFYNGGGDAAGKILVIVESPGSKVKSLQTYLGDGYLVTASVGHIMDLDSKKMSIDIVNNFTPEYKINTDKKLIVSNLQALAKEARDIILATDLDREGEMIAWSLAQVLGLNNPKRIKFGDTTKDTILQAVNNPIELNYNLINAQKTRRMLDRLVGYEISPILWKTIGGKSLAAGRVQSVVVKLIVEREREIIKFMNEDIKSSFKITCVFKDEIYSNLFQTKKVIETETEILEEQEEHEDSDKKISGQIIKLYPAILQDEKTVKNILNKLIKSKCVVSGINEKERTQNPSAPFTTSTLQQEASRKMGLPIEVTMRAAQNLYDAGHITYMRTDSVSLSTTALKKIGEYITNKFGENYHKLRSYTQKGAQTQEAHEAIRPTNYEIEVLHEHDKIGQTEIKVYNLIWKRTIASQMTPALFKVGITQISNSQLKDYYWVSQVESLFFDGFLKVYNVSQNNIKIDLPSVNTEFKYSTITAKQDYERPPTRYNEATLVNILDPKKLNIGRPATYVSIITKIQEHAYVQKKNIDGISKDILIIEYNADTNKVEDKHDTIQIGEDLNKLVPTYLGFIVTDFMQEYFKDIMDYKFTSNMETELDLIAEGKANWLDTLKRFYNIEFHPIVEQLNKMKIKFVDKNLRNLGNDPATGLPIIATIKMYGPVVYINKDGKALNTAPIKEPLTLDNITLENALKLLEFPKDIGTYKGKKIKVYTGKFGLYTKFGSDNVSLKDLKEEDISLDNVVKYIDKSMEKYLWSHTDKEAEYKVINGPYGPYINVKYKTSKKTATTATTSKNSKFSKTSKSINYKLSDDIDVKDLNIDKIKELIQIASSKKKPRYRRFVKKKV